MGSLITQLRAAYIAQFAQSAQSAIIVERCAGQLPYDHALLRQASSLLRRLPAMDSTQFKEQYITVRTAHLVQRTCLSASFAADIAKACCEC